MWKAFNQTVASGVGGQDHSILSFSFNFDLYRNEGDEAAASHISLSDDQATKARQPTSVTMNFEIGNEGVTRMKKERASLAEKVESTPPTEISATSAVVRKRVKTQENDDSNNNNNK